MGVPGRHDAPESYLHEGFIRCCPERLFADKSVLITGGTGSLGKILTKILLAGGYGLPRKITIFSRDEAKQHDMRIAYAQCKIPLMKIIYNNFNKLIVFRIGDVRNYAALCRVLRGVDIVINAAGSSRFPPVSISPPRPV